MESKEGKSGGNRLAKPLKDIRMSDVLAGVKEDHIFGYSSNEPNPSCPVGRGINKALDTLFTSIDDTVSRELGKITLASFLQKNF